MRGLGTLINTSTVIVGSSIGYFIGHRIRESIRTIVVQVIGLATVIMGISNAMDTHNLVFPLVGMVIGAVIGELLHIEERLEGIGERLKKRFAEFNVWRNIAPEPVEMTPLGLVDSESLAPRDLAVCDLVYADRTGEIYQGVYNADHRWYYFPRMTRDEAIVIKCYDSMKDGRARFSLHSAFDDPTSPANPRPRQSIETRALAFFD